MVEGMSMTPEPEYDLEAVRREEEEKAQGFKLIGEFTFWYSQLEYTIKARLAAALSISDELFDTIIAPYDFLTLCTVTKNVLTRKYSNQMDQRAVAKVFNACAALNTERVRVAHGMWTHGPGGLMASHVVRQTLQRGISLTNPRNCRG